MFAALAFSVLLAQAPSPSPTPTPDVPVYAGNPAVRFTVETRELGVTPDGEASWLAIAHFWDKDGKLTRILANSDLDWLSNDGYVQWQTRWRYGEPSAILKTTRDGPLDMTVRANKPAFGTIAIHTDTREWKTSRLVARALGPRLVQIGWFPQVRGVTRITRIDGDGRRRPIATIAGTSSTYRDTSVLPNERYTYVVSRSGFGASRVTAVTTPPNPPFTRLDNASGKAMWLFFTNDPTDERYYAHLDPGAIVDQAVRAGLHYVELRTAYGAYWEITPQARPTIDAIIDGLAVHGIGTIGWTVPRDASYDDLEQSIRTAYYQTANGTPLTGLAIDVERGDLFMGDAPEGKDALWHYLERLRDALGSGYLLVSTIEDPYLEHLTQRDYPYAQVARFSSVLQPMSYWRMMRRKPTTPQDVRVLLRASVDKVLYLSRRRLPISIGGQTAMEGRNGYPPAEEITASLETTRALGAIGECFFDWDGTQPYQWDAISAYRW